MKMNEDNTIIGGKRKTMCDFREAQDIVILGGKESSSGNDDSFFWKELLADDDKDWSKEYLGIETKDKVGYTGSNDGLPGTQGLSGTSGRRGNYVKS